MFSLTPESTNRFTADDWGLSPAVNEAILELSAAGLVKSVSLFANLPYLHHGLRELERTGVELAAHLNFTLGRPLANPVPSLTDVSGKFFPFGAFLRRGILGRFKKSDLEREARAQLDLLAEQCRITSVNGHQHVHLLPWMVAPIAAAARARGINRVRRMEDASHLPSRFATSWSARRYRIDWPEAVPESTHYLWPTGSWSREALGKKMGECKAGSLLIHPASRDDFATLEFADDLRDGRVREFDSLKELL